MAPPRRTGINTVTRVLKDGSKTRIYYDRGSGERLGEDRNAAIAAALGGSIPEGPLVRPSGRISARVHRAIYDHRLALGAAGEAFVQSELVAAGLIVCTPSSGAPYDIIVDDGERLWRVEVKTRSGVGRRTTFLLFSRGKGVAPVARNYHNHGVDILALVNWSYRAVFFVDARAAEGEKTIVVPNAEFANASSIGLSWENVAGTLPLRYHVADGASNKKSELTL
jgi:hypothetical protein